MILAKSLGFLCDMCHNKNVNIISGQLRAVKRHPWGWRKAGMMEKIYDKTAVIKYLGKLHLAEQFETEKLDFFIVKYQRGEFLSQPEQPIKYFQFMVKGNASLYYLDENGSRRNVTVIDGEGLLGDMEFVTGGMPVFYTEALTPITVLALPMEKNRKRLEQDCRFLMYLLKQASVVKMFSARNTVVFPRLDEKLIYYLENDCPHRTLTGMETSAARLRCSRRQLQRVVRKLEEQGKLVKLGRGRYRLNS
jgi:CRP/FNR family putative post-exponential-phase nitrogen-starvation transcriptional regulator